MKPHFTQRDGFVRVHIRNQGLVILPAATLQAKRNGIRSRDNPRELSLGEYSDRDGGGLDIEPRLSRPTYNHIWLVNCDFGGMVSLVI